MTDRIKAGTRVRATACFRKMDGEWVIAREHASVRFDGETGAATVDLRPSPHRVERRAMVIGIAKRRLLTRVSVAAGIWGLCYAAYRGYYAAGGTAFLPGTIRPGSEGQFRLINLAAVVVLAVAAVLPVAVLPLWARRGPRLVLLALCWGSRWAAACTP